MLPDVWWFNPTCEQAVANGTVSWQPNRTLQQFETDLSLLPLYLAAPNDVVLVHRYPSQAFLNELKVSGVDVPHLIAIEDAMGDEIFVSSSKGWLRPWGWSPAVHHLLHGLKDSCSNAFKKSPVYNWQPEYKNLYSRRLAHDILGQAHKVLDPEIFPQYPLPTICNTADQVGQVHRQNGKSMVKAPWSASGRGLLPITLAEIHPSLKQWINGVLKNQGYVMIEPLLDKKLDFALQFEVLSYKVVFQEITWFITDEKGQYKGNIVTRPDHFYNARLIEEVECHQEMLVNALLPGLAHQLIGKYEGALGVDAMIYMNGNQLKIQPCVEINLRYNMGNIALALQKKLSPKNPSLFRIGTVNELKKAKNSIPLTDQSATTRFAAWLEYSISLQ